MFRGMRGCQFVIDNDRLVCIWPEDAIEIAFADVALASYSETHGFWSVLAMGGDLLIVVLDDWRGDKLHTLLQTRLPADKQIRVDAIA
jgi:hypothetical protein